MTIDTRPPRSERGARPTSVLRPVAGASPRTTRRPSRDPGVDRGRVQGPLVVALVLACASVMVLDKAGGDDSPIGPVRTVVGDVLGPIEAAASHLTRPIADVPSALRSNADLRGESARLRRENADLQARLGRAGYDQRRLEDLAGLRRMAGDLGYALLPARVIALGGSAGRPSTLTIDAGSESGLRPDMTVVAPSGLVGRITGVTRQTATVLLVVDSGSAVGGRIADDDELGFVTGAGDLGSRDGEHLTMELADRAVVPKVGQTVVTWGSEGGAPYVAGVPIGRVSKVFESVRETSYRAVLEPAVDFTSLDLVSVVVPSGTGGRVIEADGSLR